MHAEFADQGIERHHLGGVIRRHLNRFFSRPEYKNSPGSRIRLPSGRAGIASQNSSTA